jgi:selenocysteine lyase/cysteine desulfurase
VRDQLLARLQKEHGEPSRAGRICRGPLLSRAQYLVDIEEWGYADARLGPHGVMTEAEVARWTAAIESA